MNTAGRRFSGIYTHGHHETVLRSHRWRTAANSAAYLLPMLKPGISLLDVGAGPGTITADLARVVHPGAVIALETSTDVLALTQAEIDRQGLRNVTCVVGDAHALDSANASYDVVHAHQVLQHLADPVAALREMRRVCKPDGVVAVRDADYAAFAWAPANSELDEWQALYQRLARANGGEPNAGRHVLSWASRAGFTDVAASSSTWCFATADDRAWWGGLWADRMVESTLAKQAVDTGAATSADLERIAAGWRRWAAADDGWFSVLHGEVLAR